jgi:hypothetical protein
VGILGEHCLLKKIRDEESRPIWMENRGKTQNESKENSLRKCPGIRALDYRKKKHM